MYWPLRLGVGLVLGADNSSDLVYFQANTDLVGVAILVNHLMLSFELPSFSYAVTAATGETINAMSWHGGVSASYVF